MKRWYMLLIVVLFLLPFSVVYAQDDAPLGKGNVGFKVDYIGFTDSDLKDLDVDKGVYVGLEGYVKVRNAANLYLGGEVGYAKPDGSITDNSLGTPIKVDSEFTYIPVELNAKWIFEVGNNMTLGIGAGISENRVDVEVKASAAGLTLQASDDDWIFGGQVFLDMNYSSGNLFYGIDAKYKLTQEFDSDGADYSHYSAGLHVGMKF